MNTVVMKFGGVLVQDAPAIMHSAQLVVQAAYPLPCNTFVLHTKADEATDNGDTIDIDGLERSSNLRKDKEVAE